MLQHDVMAALGVWVQARGAVQEDALVVAYTRYADEHARVSEATILNAIREADDELDT